MLQLLLIMIFSGITSVEEFAHAEATITKKCTYSYIYGALNDNRSVAEKHEVCSTIYDMFFKVIKANAERVKTTQKYTYLMFRKKEI